MSRFTDFFIGKDNDIFLMVVFILTLISTFAILGINFNVKKPQNTTNVETFINKKKTKKNTNTPTKKTPLPAVAFKDGICQKMPREQQKMCGELHEKGCNIPSCCVWLNGASCVAGNTGGPLFRTKNGKDIDVLYYSFKNQRFGAI